MGYRRVVRPHVVYDKRPLSHHPVMRFLALLGLGATVAIGCAGCITYYRPDPFSGIDLVRRDRKASVGVLVTQYHADAFFDDEGGVPHKHRDRRPDSAYTRTDIIVSAMIDFKRGGPLLVWLPISHVYQRQFEPGTWGVEHLWLGTLLRPPRERRYGLLIGVGIPLAGAIGDLHQANESHNGSTRFTAQLFASNGSPRRRNGYSLRAGFGIHLEDRPDVASIFEFPFEGRFLVPVGGRGHVGVQADFKFTVIDMGGALDTKSRDVCAVGPHLRLYPAEQWCVHLGYRKEVYGYFASAGASWVFSLTYDLPSFGRGG